MSAYVFGYGSLSAEAGGVPRRAALVGHVRVWDVAMDNRAEIGGYKYYVDPASGERPAVFVTFLDLARADGIDCTGVLLPVDDLGLAALDRRERNYDRSDVTGLIRLEGGGLEPGATVWTYLGKREARQRYASGVAAGAAVVAHSYLERVEGGFRDDPGLWAGYVASTRPPECPVIDLDRVDIPLS